MLPWYTCCFFVKHSGRTVISILKTLAEREGRNNAAALNLSKSNYLRVGIFFGSAFAVHLAGDAQIFFVIVSETSFLHLISRISTNSLYCFWPTSGIDSTKAHTPCLPTIRDIRSDLEKQIFQKLIDWEKSSNYGSVVFPNHSIVSRTILMVMGVIFIGTFEYLALDLL